MATISCKKEKLEKLLQYMTIDGSIPYVGLDATTDGKIKSVQHDLYSLGAMVVVVGEFDQFEIDEDIMFCLDAKKAIDYLKALKGDEQVQVEITDAYVIFRGSRKKITMDRLEKVDSYREEAPMQMTDDFLPLYKKGTIPTSMTCTIDANTLSEMVSDTNAVDQKQYNMHFEAPHTFKYVAKGSNQKRGNDSIEALITDIDVSGDTIDITVGVAIPQISKIFKGQIEIHCGLVDNEPTPIWFMQITDGAKVGYLIPPIADADEG